MTEPTCALTIDRSIPAGEPVNARLLLTNSTANPISVLQYHTPFEGILGPVFIVTFKGKQLIYQGPLVKRGPPQDEDWLEVGTGDSLSAEVDIGGAWELGSAGDYGLKLSAPITYRVAGNDELRQLAAGACGSVEFTILAR